MDHEEVVKKRREEAVGFINEVEEMVAKTSDEKELLRVIAMSTSTITAILGEMMIMLEEKNK